MRSIATFFGEVTVWNDPTEKSPPFPSVNLLLANGQICREALSILYREAPCCIYLYIVNSFHGTISIKFNHPGEKEALSKFRRVHLKVSACNSIPMVGDVVSYPLRKFIEKAKPFMIHAWKTHETLKYEVNICFHTRVIDGGFRAIQDALEKDGKKLKLQFRYGGVGVSKLLV